MSDWDLVKIEDIGDVKSGKRLPKDHSLICDETPFPYIRLVDVSDGRIRRDNLQYLTEATKEKIQKYVVNTSDVCLAIVGHTIGMVFYVDSEWDNNNLTENAARITNIREDIVSRYLYYFLISPQGQTEILSRKVGSAQGKLPLYNIKSLEVLLPPLAEQKAIAHTLGCLDDKIELNRQMNETLEAMAQALFKSWFVDFDPVIDNALAAGNAIPDELLEHAEQRKSMEKKDNLDIQSLFPDEFEFTEEMGWIPKGWGVKSLDEVADYLNGLALQKYRPEDIDDNYLPIVKIAQLREGLPNHDEKASINIKPEYIIDNGDVIFSWSGSLLVDVWCGGKAALNQHLFKVTSDKYPKWFYLNYTKHHLVEFQRIATDKAVTMGHIKRGHLKEALCVIPENGVDDNIFAVFEGILNKQIRLRIESQTLAKLRDTLLPKLMSGELRIPDAAAFVENI